MKHSNRCHGALAFAALAAFPALAAAEEVIAVTATGHLVTFDSATPGTIVDDHVVSGVTGTIVAIDIRPLDGMLFAVTDGARVYRIDPATGAGVQIGSAAFGTVIGSNVGADFNPVVDRLRIVNDLDRNLRLVPADASVVDSDGGTLGVQEDTPLSYAALDTNFGQDPSITAVAYDNNTVGALTTTLFGIDTLLNVLVSSAQPNTGVLATVGPLGVDTSADVGFDISRTTAAAYAAIRPEGALTSNLYTINTLTGAATLVGTIGGGSAVKAMTLGPASAPQLVPARDMLGLTTGGELVRFSTAAPQTIVSRVAVSGLVAGDSLVGIDVRPANGILYGVGSQGRLYAIHGSTGVASQVGTGSFETPLSGTTFGVDFNPAADRLRIVSDSDLNLRVNPADGTVVDGDLALAGTQPDTNLAYDLGDTFAGSDPFVTGAAYDRNDAKALTTLYDVDVNRDTLVRQGDTGGTPASPNSGILHTVGSLGVDTNEHAGFEIAGDTLGLLSLTGPTGASRLYSVNLAVGAATLIDTIGTSETLRGLTIVPTANPAPPIPLVVTKLNIKIDHCPPGGRDTVQIHGRVPRPSSVSGKVVIVDVGGFTETFTLTAKGSGKNTEGTRPASDDDEFKYTARRSNGVSDFIVNIRREDVSDELADEGLTPEVVRGRQTSVRVTITVDGVSYTALVPVRYTAGNGHDGTVTKR